MRGRGFAGLVAVTVLVAALAALTLERDEPEPEAGQLLFADLLAAVNDVERVAVTSAGETFVLARAADGTWSAPSRGGYPVQGDKIHNLIVGTAGLTRLQPKTGKPERFAELGLRDPGEKDSRAVGFVLFGGGDSRLAELIVGERRPAKGDPTRTEYFVRVPGEDRSWLVVGTLPADADAVEQWLEPRIVALAGSRIARVRITHPDGETVTASKATPTATEFRYEELPQGAELDGLWRINDVGRLLTDLTLDDVKPASDVARAADAVEVVTETYDGLRVRMHVQGTKEAPAVFLEAEFDPALVRAVEGDAAPEGLLAEDAVRAEVDALNERWAPWAYVVPGYKYDYARRRAETMIKQPKPAS